MGLTKETKQEILKSNRRSDKDTGSPEVQIALLTERINHLTEHFKKNKKDHHSKFGLQKMVNQRKKLLKYLMKKDLNQYKALIKKLKLRK